MMKYRQALAADIPRLTALRVAMLNEERAYSDAFNVTLYKNTAFLTPVAP